MSWMFGILAFEGMMMRSRFAQKDSVSITISLDKALDILPKHVGDTLESIDEMDIPIYPSDIEQEEDESEEEYLDRLDEERFKIEEEVKGDAFRAFTSWVESIFDKIHTHGGGSVEATYNENTGEFTLDLTNPDTLFRELLEGYGLYSPGVDDDFSDPGMIKSHLVYLTDYYEIYGDRMPDFDWSY